MVLRRGLGWPPLAPGWWAGALIVSPHGGLLYGVSPTIAHFAGVTCIHCRLAPANPGAAAMRLDPINTLHPMTSCTARDLSSQVVAIPNDPLRMLMDSPQPGSRGCVQNP